MATSHKRKTCPKINYSAAPRRSDRRYNLAMSDAGWRDLDALRRAFPDMSIASIITRALWLKARLEEARALSAIPEEQPPQQDGRG